MHCNVNSNCNYSKLEHCGALWNPVDTNEIPGIGTHKQDGGTSDEGLYQRVRVFINQRLLLFNFIFDLDSSVTHGVRRWGEEGLFGAYIDVLQTISHSFIYPKDK